MPGILIQTDNAEHFAKIVGQLKLDWKDEDLSIQIDGTGFAAYKPSNSTDAAPMPAAADAVKFVGQNPIKTETHIENGKVVGVSIAHQGSGWVGKSIIPEPPTEYDYVQKRGRSEANPNVATESKFAQVGSQRVSISHPVATEENSATILYGLLHSFVEVAAAFPPATLDVSLANEVRRYLPYSKPDPQAKIKTLQECNQTQANTIGSYQREVAELKGRVEAQRGNIQAYENIERKLLERVAELEPRERAIEDLNQHIKSYQQTVENMRNEIIRLKGLIVEPRHHNPLIQG